MSAGVVVCGCVVAKNGKQLKSLVVVCWNLLSRIKGFVTEINDISKVRDRPEWMAKLSRSTCWFSETKALTKSFSTSTD